MGVMYLRGNIRKIIKKLVKKYKTRDPFELCTCLGIWVYKIPLGNTKGYYTYAERKKVIFINAALSTWEKIIVCAHELAHAILHPDGNVYYKKNNTYYVLEKFEIPAQTFAAELLISDEMVSECPSYFTIDQMAAYLSTTSELMKLKLIV
jgi:Zn-dependent peptidase ImmA (M78 family)